MVNTLLTPESAQSRTTITKPPEPGRNLSDFAAFLVTQVPGVPDTLQEQALRLGAWQFCRDTEIWRAHWSISTIADQKEYDLTRLLGYPNASVYRLVSVAWQERPVYEQSATLDNYGVLRLREPLTILDGQRIDVEAVVRPDIAAKVYPKWLLDSWWEGIVERAAAGLKGMAGRPWSDPDGAAAAMAQYEDWRGKAVAYWTSRHRGMPSVELSQEGFA